MAHSLPCSILACAVIAAAGMPAQEAGPPDGGVGALSRLDPESKRLKDRVARLEVELSTLARIPQEQTGERLGYHSRIQQDNPEPLWVQIDLGSSQVFDSIVVVPVVLPKEQGGIEGYGFPVGLLLESSETLDFASPVKIAEFTDPPLPNPGRVPLIIPCPGAKGRHMRLTTTIPAGRRNTAGRVIWPFLALAEVMVMHGDRNLAAGRTVTAPTSREAAPLWSLQNLTDSESVLGAPVSSTTVTRKGWHSAPYPEADTPVTITLDLHEPLPLDDVRLFPMRWEGYPHWVGFGFPVRFKVECASDASFTQPHVIADFTQSDFPNPGINPVVMQADGAQAQFVRITTTRQWERFNDHAVALAEVQVYAKDRNAAREASVQTTSTYPAKEWNNAFLIDGDASDNPILPLPEWLAQLQKSASLESELVSLQATRAGRRAFLERATWSAGMVLFALALILPTALLVRNSLRRRRELRQLRERIARDLHDEVGSNLAGIALLSREAGKASDAQRGALLDEIRQVAEETAGSMRDLVWMIQPGAPGDLVAGLRTLAERMLKGIHVNFQPPRAPWRGALSLDAKRDIYLMCKEALQNIVKHSNATEVALSIQPSGGALAISIRDNGGGFDAATPTTGFGLPNLRERARRLGGTCELKSSPQGGTAIHIHVPLSS